MSITRHTLPEHATTDLMRHLGLQNLLVSGWETTSLATQKITHDLTTTLDTTTDPATLAYSGWELLTITSETTELLGTMFRHHQQPQTRFHQTTNTQLHKLFARLARTPPSPDELRKFLHLPVPPSALQPLEERTLTNAATALQHLARFWTTRIDAIRTFRHYPAGLTIKDLRELDPAPHNQRDAIISQITALPELIDAYALHDQGTFDYTALTKTEARAAASLTSIAIQLIFTRNSNTILNPSSTKDEERLPKLYPILLTGLTPDERERLKGTYALVE